MRRRPRTAAIPLALFVLALGLAVSACGGGDDENPRTVVNQTFTGNKKVDSGKLDMSVTARLRATGLAASQLKEPIVIRMSGPFQSRGEDELPAMDLTLSATGSGQDFSAGAISTGDRGYVTFQGKPYNIPPSVFERFRKGFERQQRQDKRSSGNLDLRALGIDPEKWLKNPKNEGEEEVGGAETTHVSSDVNLDALLDDVDRLLQRADRLGLSRQQLQRLPEGLTSQNRKTIQDAIKRAKVDIWTGKDDKTLRRIELKVVFELPQAVSDQLSGVQGGDVDIKLELADINEKQEIKAPANPRPWSELQRQLQGTTLGSGLGSGTGGAGAGTGSPGSGSSGPGSKRTQRYLKCVQEASTPENLQKCAAILGR